MAISSFFDSDLISSIVAKRFLCISFFSFGNRKKSQGAKFLLCLASGAILMRHCFCSKFSNFGTYFAATVPEKSKFNFSFEHTSYKIAEANVWYKFYFTLLLSFLCTEQFRLPWSSVRDFARNLTLRLLSAQFSTAVLTLERFFAFIWLITVPVVINLYVFCMLFSIVIVIEVILWPLIVVLLLILNHP